MCLSFAGQLLFGISMVIVLGLTIMSMFSPGIEQLEKVALNITEDLKHFTIPEGFNLLETLCRFASNTNVTINKTDSIDFCKKWFHELEDWEKIVVVFMCLAVITEVITICWTIITCCGCTCQKMCLQLSPILSLLVALFLAGGVTIFAMNNQTILDKIVITGNLSILSALSS
ncbi:unnamed protein product [Onchocerca flexuosa]|uniref:Tetraspanin n=1 Tax=Onchocerca flexuosa TaxID=387005 RepID=A0A183HKK7_9BILA|nr:unnamed protein product [Onchocerca flexuosa]